MRVGGTLGHQRWSDRDRSAASPERITGPIEPCLDRKKTATQAAWPVLMDVALITGLAIVPFLGTVRDVGPRPRWLVQDADYNYEIAISADYKTVSS